MKNLIKFVVLIVVLAILAFSENPTIVKGRTFVVENVKKLLDNAKPVYDKTTDKMQSSDNETVAKIGKTLK